MKKKRPQDFKKGDPRINRKGRPPKDWTWAGLLRDLAEQLHEKTGVAKKEIIASALFKEAMKGNVMAIKEFGDRIDGKSKQTTDVTSGGEKINFTWKKDE